MNVNQCTQLPSVPGANQDVTQGYIVGSIWFNTAVAGGIYICTRNSAGAAVWTKVAELSPVPPPP